ncbi:MAG: glycosyltransferase family A protein [Phycisphaerales bacterium]
MARTASPAVSVIVPLIARADQLERAGAALRAQTLRDFELILVGGSAGADSIASLRADDRVRREAPGLGLIDALNAGLDACRGDRVMIVDPRDELTTSALEALAVRMHHGGESGAFGGFRFTAPIGELAPDPLRDAPDCVGLDELLACQWFPLSAMMVDAAQIGGIHFRAPDGASEPIHPHEYEWLLRLADVGVRWSRSRLRVASVRLRTLEKPGIIERALRARVRLIHERMTAREHSETDVRIVTQPAVDACLGLVADRDHPPALYCDASNRSHAEMARWWQRFGFVGAAPQHLNPFERQVALNETAARTRRAAEALDPRRPVVVVGTGAGAPMLSGTIASLGGRPYLCAPGDALPGWVAETEARVLRSGLEAPAGSQFVLTESDVRVNVPPGADLLSIDQFESTPSDERASIAPDGSIPPPQAPKGLLALPALLRALALQQLDPRLPVALLGLGRNARLLARSLQGRFASILGVDDGLASAPWWAEVDGIDSLSLVPRSALPPEAQLVMTVVKDAGFMRALRRDLPHARVFRWSLAADVLIGVAGSAWDEPAAHAKEAA